MRVGERTLIACLYRKIQKSSLRLQGQRPLVLIVKENNRVTRTIAVTKQQSHREQQVTRTMVTYKQVKLMKVKHVRTMDVTRTIVSRSGLIIFLPIFPFIIYSHHYPFSYVITPLPTSLSLYITHYQDQYPRMTSFLCPPALLSSYLCIALLITRTSILG